MEDWYDVEKQEWTEESLENLMVFCILDTQMTYQKVCDCYDALKAEDLISRNTLSYTIPKRLEQILRSAGCRFPRQKAKYLWLFGNNPVDLRFATREELVNNIKGVGMKLASMFLNRTRGTQYAIIDVHIAKYLKERLVYTGNYLEDEKNFSKLALIQGMSVTKLDNEVWEEYRVK